MTTAEKAAASRRASKAAPPGMFWCAECAAYLPLAEQAMPKTKICLCRRHNAQRVRERYHELHPDAKYNQQWATLERGNDGNQR